MPRLKLSKSGLAEQRGQLQLYKKLLPTLDLKRRQLTVELEKAREEHEKTEREVTDLDARIGAQLPMIANPDMNLSGLVEMTDFKLSEENVVGVKLPRLDTIECKIAPYAFLAKPAWIDLLVDRLKEAAEQRIRVQVAEERVRLLEQSVRRFTQRFNLFDKILIPRAEKAIKRIRIFLGDQERDAVVRSKLAKAKHAMPAVAAEPEGERPAMTIVDLQKITLIGFAEDKERVLEDIQDLGCMQIIPLGRDRGDDHATGPSSNAREALRFLLSCPDRRLQVKKRPLLDAEKVEKQAHDLRTRLNALRQERDFLRQRIRALEPWGDFEFPPLEQMGGNRLWFYVVPHHQMSKLDAIDLPWEVVKRGEQSCYVAIISSDEPEGMPVPRTLTGAKPRHVLEERLDEVRLEIQDVHAERSSLTRWCLLFAESLNQLEDRAELLHVATQTHDDDALFGLQAWAPRERLTEVEAYAAENALLLERHDPEPDDQPPTLLENKEVWDAGEGLVQFYMTPGYFTWDPSSVVLLSFAVFFGMILADAGYAAVMGLVLWRYWKRMGQSEGSRRFRTICASLTGATFLYGLMVGSYFGVTPPTESLLGRLHVLDLSDADTMMLISVVVGVVHVVLANVMDAYRYGRSAKALAPVGWASFIAGGLVAGLAMQADQATITSIGVALMGAGLLLILVFSGVGKKPLARIGAGFLALTKITSAFGDVLSYLRLFALGLATASLAVAFNDMAGQIRGAVPGVGLLFALLVLLIGHAMNLVLGISSGVIHGLRLNVIEFFNWGVREEGIPYRPFKRKEGVPWKPTS